MLPMSSPGPLLHNHRLLARVLAAVLLYSSIFPALALHAYAVRDAALDQVLGERITICTERGMVQMGLDEYRLKLQLGHSLAWTDALLAHAGPAILPDRPSIKLALACAAAPGTTPGWVPPRRRDRQPQKPRAPPIHS